MPAARRTSSPFALDVTTAVSTPARRSRLTQATEPGNASTPSRASARSTSACLRLPMPCTDHSSAGLSALPSGASIPRARRKSRTPS